MQAQQRVTSGATPGRGCGCDAPSSHSHSCASLTRNPEVSAPAHGSGPVRSMSSRNAPFAMSPAADSRCHAVWMSGSFGANSSPTNATPPSAEAAMCSRCARRRCGCCCARRRKSTCAAGGDRGSGHQNTRLKRDFRVVDCARRRSCTCETEAIRRDFAARRGQTCFRQKLRAATDRADSAAQHSACPHPARWDCALQTLKPTL